MRYDAEHKEKTRQRVLKEAARALREDGPEKIAVAGIMAAAGLTHGGFYAHFKSKDDLVAAAIDETFKDAGGRFARSTDGFTPEEGMVRYINFYLSREHRDARGTGCPVPTLSADLARLPEAARERYGLGVARLTGLVQGQLERLGRDDAEILAPSVVAELVGAVALARAVSDPEQSNEILRVSRQAVRQRLGLDHIQLKAVQ